MRLFSDRFAILVRGSVLAVLVCTTVAQSPAFAQTATGGLVRANDIVDEREDGSGAFRTHCLESHASHDDPLVYPGRAGAAHYHVFFGNPTVDAQTTIADLNDATRTTCDGKTLNRSAYWVPALYDGRGARIEYVDPLFYYKTGYHVPAASIEPPPEGLRMIAGNAHATAPQGTHVAKFRCASWPDDGQWFDPGDPLDHVDYLPDCAPDDLLEVRVVFPQCWDGQTLFAPDNQSHMAYPREAEPPVAGTGACPASHPVAIPEISYNFAIYVTAETGPPSTWRLSSDRPEVTIPGVSLHADWMNGWDPEIMETIVENCLRPARECGVGLLGNGTRLWPVVRD
ncbi:MAG: DUF1996 domain-containing protein [Pseudomonadota bacterium]